MEKKISNNTQINELLSEEDKIILYKDLEQECQNGVKIFSCEKIALSLIEKLLSETKRL